MDAGDLNFHDIRRFSQICYNLPGAAGDPLSRLQAPTLTMQRTTHPPGDNNNGGGDAASAAGPMAEEQFLAQQS